jgi:hypothetical protein
MSPPGPAGPLGWHGKVRVGTDQRRPAYACDQIGRPGPVDRSVPQAV